MIATEINEMFRCDNILIKNAAANTIIYKTTCSKPKNQLLPL